RGGGGGRGVGGGVGRGGGRGGPAVSPARQKGGRGERDLKVRLRTGKGRSLSQRLWLERQLNDPYVARARREGFRSRAAYKLIEIDDKHHFLKAGSRGVDLGAAPRGRSQIAAQRGGADTGPRRAVAVGLLQ